LKKLFLILALLVSVVFAAETSTAPKWTDFCEAGYENAVYKNTDDLWNIVSFVKTERIKKNYWAERRESFEKYLKTCEVLDSSAKESCYTELTNAENEKNELYNIKRKQLLDENNDIRKR